MGKNDNNTDKKKSKKVKEAEQLLKESEQFEKIISEAREIVRSDEEERKRSESPVPMEDVAHPEAVIDVSGDVNTFGRIDGSESDDEEMKQMRKAMRKMRLQEEYRLKVAQFASQRRSRQSSPVARSVQVSSSHIPSRMIPMPMARTSRPSVFHDGYSVGSESVRSENEIKLEKQVKEMEKEKKKNKKCCTCSTASACAGNLCGCKNTRKEGCGKGCGCQTTSPNGCFNPETKKELRTKYKHVGRAGYVLKHYKNAEKRGANDAIESDTGSSDDSDSD